MKIQARRVTQKKHQINCEISQERGDQHQIVPAAARVFGKSAAHSKSALKIALEVRIAALQSGVMTEAKVTAYQQTGSPTNLHGKISVLTSVRRDQFVKTQIFQGRAAENHAKSRKVIRRSCIREWR